MSAPEKFHDVIVVGGGISGLYAARCLTKEGVDVVALEAQDHVGGRSLTKWSPEYGFSDMGGAYVGPAQTKLISLVEELGGSVYPVKDDGKSVLLDGQRRILFTEEKFPLKFFFSLVDLNSALKTLDAMSMEVPLREPWNAPKAKEWDSISVEQFIRKTCWTRTVQDIIITAVDLIYVSSSSSDISLLVFLHLNRVCGGMRAMIGSINGLQGMKITEGSSSVSEKMAAELKDRVKLNTTVASIDQTKELVEIRTEFGDVYRCRQVIMAVCPLVLRHIDIKPELPSVHQAYIDHKAYSNMIKTVVYYKKRYWADKGLKGEFMALDRICTYGLDDTKADGSHPAIMCFVYGSKYENLTMEQRKEILLKLLVEAFNVPEMAEPIGYVEKEWGLPESDRYHGICVHSSPPGFLTKYRSLWGESQDKIHFAGAEAALTMRGYMDGGLRAAEAATAKVLKALGRTPSREYETKPIHVPFVPMRPEERLLPSLPTLVGILVGLVAVPLAYVFSKL